MYLYFTLILSIVCNAAANILTKFGMARLSAESFSLFRIILNPLIIGGAICFGISLLSYCYVLSKINLSIAYPILTSACFMIVVLFSWLFLKEKLILIQVAGFFLIVFGIWLVAKGIQ